MVLTAAEMQLTTLTFDDYQVLLNQESTLTWPSFLLFFAPQGKTTNNQQHFRRYCKPQDHPQPKSPPGSLSAFTIFRNVMSLSENNRP